MTINMPRSLNSDQFETLARDLDAGGFTMRAYGVGAGRPGRNILSVGGQVADPNNLVPTPARGGDIQSFAERHREALSQPSMNLGGWIETETHGALDVSKEFPRTPEGHAGARAEVLAKNEIAYGVLGDKPPGDNYMGDIDNPYHPERILQSKAVDSPAARAKWATSGVTDTRLGKQLVVPKRRSGGRYGG